MEIKGTSLQNEEQLTKEQNRSGQDIEQSQQHRNQAYERDRQLGKEDLQNIRQYMQYFRQVDDQIVSINSRLRYIKNEQSNFYPNMTIFNVQHSKNYEIVVLQIRLGSFSTKLKIINSNQKSPFHSCRLAGFGSFGDVYTLTTNNLKYKYYQRYAIKCFPINTQKGRFPSLKDILKQIFILKLTNEIDGIYNSDEFVCFDLVYFTNCLQLSMQKLGWSQNIIKSRQSDLKKSLKTFHKIGLIHSDIKKENIAYNSHIAKWVFIDFGLSLFIKETIQQKTQTKFQGNFRNASPQMKKISRENQQGYANLYFNDYYGLMQTLMHFKQDQSNKTLKLQESFNINLNQSVLQKISFFLFVLKMKFYLYGLSMDNQKMCKLFSQFKQINDQNMAKIILKFMNQVKVSTLSKIFYDSIVKQKEEALWLVYKNRDIEFNQVQEDQEFRERFASLCQNKDINISFHFNANNIEETLLNYQKLRSFDKELYFTNIINFISFTQNRYRKTTQEKSMACKVFNNIYSNTKHQNNDCIYQPLHQTVNFILHYCLSQPFTNWKKLNLFNVLTQWLILGKGNDNKISNLINFFQKNRTSSAQQAFMLYLLYQHFVWDINILIKSEHSQILYTRVIQKLHKAMIELALQYKQKNIEKYLHQRIQRYQSTQRNQIEKDLIVAVEFLINLSFSQRYDLINTNNVMTIDSMLGITSNDAFVQLYGQDIYRAFLNFGIKMIDSSFIESKQIFKALLFSQENQGQIKYYYFNTINALKKLKQSKLALSLLKKWKNNINDSNIWSNSMMNYFMVEQMAGQHLQNLHYSTLIRKSIQTIKPTDLTSIRVVLNVFKSIQIFSLIIFNMPEKQYVFIKNKCRINYYQFSKTYEEFISVANLRRQINVAYNECSKYFDQFQHVLDWIAFKYVVFLKRKLLSCIQLFGKYLDVPLIMRGYNFFYLFLRCSQVLSSTDYIIQNNYLYFLNFLIQTSKRKESLEQIIKSYESIRNDFSAQLLDLNSITSINFYKDEEFTQVIYNIDFLLLNEIRYLKETTKITYKNYVVEIMLKMNISILMVIRKYDKVGDFFPKKVLQSLFFKKIFNIQLQLKEAALYKKQIIALYVQYLGNLYATFNKLLIKVNELQSFDVGQKRNQIEIYFTSKIMSLIQILRVTKNYCLIRYFNVWRTYDILFFKVLLKSLLSLPQNVVNQQVIKFINIMSEVYDNKESWRHFFVIKQLFQLDLKFNEQYFIKFIKILLTIRWTHLTKMTVFNNNYRLVKFLSTMVCSLIDCLLTNNLNIIQQLVISPILQLTSFQCIIQDHPLVVKLIKIEERFLQKLTLRDKIQIFPFLLMIAIFKIKQINSSKSRFKLYLHRKMIKSLIINDWGNLSITYCKNYLIMCQKIHKYYFKQLFSCLKDIHNKQKRMMKMKVYKYYPSQGFNQNNKIELLCIERADRNYP